MKQVTLFFFLVMAFTAAAQKYEIRAMYKDNNVVGVEMRTIGAPLSTGNFITDIVFGLKWQNTAAVDLGSNLTTSYNIKKSDARKAKGSYYFQAFYADNTPFQLPAIWPQNSWIEIMRVAVVQNAATTFDICETGFDPTTDPNLGIDLVDYTPLINGSVPLPVSLLNFEAVPQKKAIKLSWQTANEINNKGFIVQRSKDGVAFDSIGWIGGRSTTSSLFSYLFIDFHAEPNVLYYYRLKQQDIDDKVSFSSIKSARLKGEGAETFSLSPNPAAALLKLAYSASAVNEKVHIKVIDNIGSVITDVEKALVPGASVSIDVSMLPGGAYYLVVERNKEVLFSKAFQKL